MQEVCEIICRYALETGELPTLAEVARRIGLTRTRVAGIWWRIEQWERHRDRLPAKTFEHRAKAGYLMAVLKDIERAAKMAGRIYPWRRKWQGPPKPSVPRPNPPRPWATQLSDAERHAEIERLAERERRRRHDEPARSYRPRFAGFVECSACHGTAVQDGDWCPVCKGEGTTG